MPQPVVELAEGVSSPGKPSFEPARSLRAPIAAGAIGVFAVIAWRFAPPLFQHTEGTFTNDLFYLRATVRLTILLAATAAAAFVLLPSVTALVSHLRRSWRSAFTPFVLAALCGFQWAFIVHAGRLQFGAFDASNLMQEGWREFLGQRPYTDFLATTPPAFNLGIKYAYQLLGVSWDSGLYLTAFFTCATFLWLYWLLTRLALSRFAAVATAFAIEAAAMLTLSFWWYNNVTTILAAVLFLSSLFYATHARSVSAQISYVVSLALTSLTKPNMAGLTILGCLAMLLIVCERRLHTLLLTLAAALASIAILLLNHISIPALIASYRFVAGERGFGSIGFLQMNDYEQYSSFAWLPILSLPLLALIPRLKRQVQRREGKAACLSLFFLLGPAIAAYGVATNGEFRQVECTVLLASSAVVAFGMRLNRPLLLRVFSAFLIASVVGDVYMALQRLRIYDGGQHTFFEWQDNQNRIQAGVLENMRVSATMIGVERQIQDILQMNPGPYYFGPRLDFNNAVFQLPMAEHLPAWWHPGTAFPRSDVPHLIDLWHSHGFQTLIFLKGDLKDAYTYYPQEFLDEIHRNYIADDRSPTLTVYHRLSSSPADR